MVVIDNEVQMRNAPTSVLLKTAQDIVSDICQDSKLFDEARFQILPRFGSHEIQTARIIGRGGFCTIKEIGGIKVQAERRNSFGGSIGGSSHGSGASGTNSKKNKGSRGLANAFRGRGDALDRSVPGTEMSSKEYIAFSAVKGGQPKYVIKQVAAEWVYQNRVIFLKGTVDLALEAKFLASLNHPNIIELRGLSESGLYREGSFLILDKLHETLPKTMKRWTTTDRQCKGITGSFVGGKKKINALFTARMKAAFDVANALNYIHSLDIVYRDLKPDNIGLDAKGNIKIFDFGLAKELKEKDQTENGFYNLTGFTGSIRYMAPEVGLRRPYNQKADNYSFSMLLWYIMALEPPYGFYTPEMFVSRVFHAGHRPVTLPDWPNDIATMMKRCWDIRINQRPSFLVIMEVIKREIAKVDVELASKLVPFM